MAVTLEPGTNKITAVNINMYNVGVGGNEDDDDPHHHYGINGRAEPKSNLERV